MKDCAGEGRRWNWIWKWIWIWIWILMSRGDLCLAGKDVIGRGGSLAAKRSSPWAMARWSSQTVPSTSGELLQLPPVSESSTTRASGNPPARELHAGTTTRAEIVRLRHGSPRTFLRCTTVNRAIMTYFVVFMSEVKTIVDWENPTSGSRGERALPFIKQSAGKPKTIKCRFPRQSEPVICHLYHLQPPRSPIRPRTRRRPHHPTAAA